MTLLRGHFAMTLICAGQAERGRAGAGAGARPWTPRWRSRCGRCPTSETGPRSASTYLVTVHGADRLGIVARLAGHDRRRRAATSPT